MKDLKSMPAAPDEEQARLKALNSYGILDTPTEVAFDDLAHLAALVCDTPTARITFVDDRRQFFKARTDVQGAREAALDVGFCHDTVRQGALLVIPDTRADPRFRDNPAVTADPPVRFYAGVPLCAQEGQILGTLCVMAPRPQSLSQAQDAGLRALGRQVETLLELRRTADAHRRAEEASRRSERQIRSVTDTLPVLMAYVDAEQRYRFHNRQYEEWMGLSQDQILGRTIREALGEDFYQAVSDNVAAALAGETVTYAREMIWPNGLTRWVRGTYVPHWGADGDVEGFAILVADETDARRAEEERRVAAERQAILIAAQQEIGLAERDLEAVLDIITRRTQEMTGADGAVVEMADGEEMVYRAASGTAAAHLGLRLRRETSLSGRCVTEGRLLSCADAETDDRVDAEACRRIGVRSLVVVPLLFLGRVVGVLKVYSAAPHAFKPDVFPLLELMVSVIVAALSAVSEAEARSALVSSEQRLRALITSVPVILFALDADGIFTQSEGRGLEALGLASGELVGRSYRDVYAKAPTLLAGVGQGLAGEATQWLAELGGLFFETQCLPLRNAQDVPAGLIGVAFNVTERVRAEQALRQSAARQRQFLRDVLASVTEGRLILCQSEAELPSLLAPASGPISLSQESGLRELRQAAGEVCRAAGLSEERSHDMITAVSEAGMNCIVHVGAGVGAVFMDTDSGTVQACISDHGHGISLENLPNATLKKGFTTAGTLGHGMKMMLQTADRIYLLTNRSGTTVVVEQERVAPLPIW